MHDWKWQFSTEKEFIICKYWGGQGYRPHADLTYVCIAMHPSQSAAELYSYASQPVSSGTIIATGLQLWLPAMVNLTTSQLAGSSAYVHQSLNICSLCLSLEVQLGNKILSRLLSHCLSHCMQWQLKDLHYQFDPSIAYNFIPYHDIRLCKCMQS